MNKNIFTSVFFALAVFTLTTISGCGAIEGIFKAGVWVGVIVVVAIVGIILVIVKSIGGGK